MWENGPIVPPKTELIGAESLPEVKRESLLHTVHQANVTAGPHSRFPLAGLDRISSWHRAKRVIANCVPYKLKIKLRGHTEIRVREMENAAKLIILSLQKEHFALEFRLLKMRVHD